MADLTVSVGEGILNQIVQQLISRRPFLFNYAAPTWTPPSVQPVFLLAVPIPTPPGTTSSASPLLTVVPPAPLASGGLGLPWCLQITNIQIDFVPSDVFQLPSELSPPLAAQSFGLMATAQFGLGCADSQALSFTRPTLFANNIMFNTIPAQHLDQFTLQFYCVGQFIADQVATTTGNRDRIGLQLDNLEIVDLTPSGLEAAVECYLSANIRLFVLPRLRQTLDPIVQNILGNTVTLTPHLTPGVLPNPAIAGNSVTIALDL